MHWSADKLLRDADFHVQQHNPKTACTWFVEGSGSVLGWPANSPDLNWCQADDVGVTRPTNTGELKATVKISPRLTASMSHINDAGILIKY